MRLSAFPETGDWYKGNLHAHSNLSDGKISPAALAERYRREGYAFLAITDHRRFAYHRELERPGFLLLPATEQDICIPGTYRTHHLVGISSPGRCAFPDGFSLEFMHEERIWTGEEAARYLVEGGCLVIYAHPNWSQVLAEEFDTVTSVVGMEIFNFVSEHVHGNGYSDAFFDRMLQTGRKGFCFAADDTHQRVSGDLFGGYIMVKAERLSHEDLLSAIEKGHFYASQGPEIRGFYIEDGWAVLETSPCDVHSIQGGWTRGFAQRTAGAQRFAYRLEGHETYLRACCTDSRGKKAWSQPLYLK